jgi:hypothetical protein
MGACADKLYTLRNTRLTMQKAVDAVDAEERALKQHIIDNLPKSEASGVSGKLARVTVVVKQVPQVKDWEAFWKGFLKSRDFDMMGKVLNKAAVEARWEAGKKVPGVEPFNVVTVSINKV